MALEAKLKVKREGDGLKKMPVLLEATSARLSQRAAQALVRVAKKNAPVGSDTYTDSDGHEHPGWLRDSIHATRISEGHWVVSIDAEYAVYLEYGTRYMRARPFWRRSIRETKEVVFRDAASSLTRLGRL